MSGWPTGGLALLAAVWIAAPANAATFAPAPATDDVDSAPGDGLCSSAAGVCTLRAAVQEANALPGPDRIELAGQTYTLTLALAAEDEAAGGDLDIAGELEVVGGGATASVISARDPEGVARDRVIDVLEGAKVSLERLGVRDGEVDGEDGGGIYNAGELTLREADVANNRALAGFDMGGVGGGILNAGTLRLERSSVRRNRAELGGGVANAGTAEAVNATIAGNTAGSGGAALATLAGSASLTHVTMTGNGPTTTDGPPSGIANQASTTVRASILGHCEGPAPVTSRGFNIDAGTSCGLGVEGDRPATDARAAAGALERDGHYLAPIGADSPARNAATADGCPPVDQRGTARPQGPACDIGAYEHPEADLAVVPGPAPGGLRFVRDPVQFPFTIVNRGTAPSGVSVIANGRATGACTSPVRCRLSAIEPGGAAEIVVHLSSLIPGELTARVQLTGQTVTDPVGSNNEATLSVRVYNPGSCANLQTGGAGADALAGTPVGDRIDGGDGPDRIFGFDGIDCLFGGGGADELDGGPGDDSLRGGVERDRLVGGDGDDELAGESGGDSLAGGVGGDTLGGGDGNDRLMGDSGDDTLKGAAGRDFLSGGAGRDVLVGGGGRNRYSAGAGGDYVNSRNRVRERVDCGRGRDRVKADRFDVLRSCERRSR